MSIPVEIKDLQGALAEFGSGYLLTTTRGRVKVVTVDPEYDGSGLRLVDPGRGTLANLVDNPAATLVFPPLQPKGYTLLVDGTGIVAGEDVRVEPISAVLHRPRSHADGPVPEGGCGNDCAPV